MSKRKRTQTNFFVGLKLATNKVSTTAYWEAPTGGPRVYTYKNQLFSSHWATYVNGNGKGRRALGYAMHAIKVQRNSYDYTISRSGGTRFWSDQTDTVRGYGLADYSTWGLKPSGGKYVPDVSDDLVTRAINECKLKLAATDLNLATSVAEARDAFNTIAGLAKSIAGIVQRLSGYGYVKQVNFYEVTVVRKSKRKVFGTRVKARTAFLDETYYRKRTSESDIRPGKQYYKETTIDPDSWKLGTEYVSGLEKAWLNAMYGILPLWMDMMAAADDMATSLAKPGSHIEALRVITRQGDLPKDPHGYFNWSCEGKYEYGAECKLGYRMRAPITNYAAGLGLLNPFALWWELTPFSFVFDWLVPVGNMLGGMTVDMGLDFETGFTNRKSYIDFEVVGCLHENAQGKIPSVRFRNVSQVRTAMVTTPITGLYIKSPFSATHTISAIALLAQQIRK